MKQEKEVKLREFLLVKEFREEQINLVVKLIDSARGKMIEEIIIALETKKVKITNEAE